MNPTITWVNHASLIYDDGHARLICDPWLEGRTFYNGWDLLAPTAMSFDDFDSITHIWISHEHPDHLSPPNLSRIPAEVRAKITMLYQKSPVQRVVKYLRTLGFKEVIEIEPEWFRLSPATEIYCGPCRSTTSDDSYLALRTDGVTTLNLNDCVPPNLAEIKKKVGPIDVLLAQFSFACWTGNRNQADKRRLAAEKAKAMFLKNVRTLDPKCVIPAASFSWFCNVENYWMNEISYRVGEISREVSKLGITPVVLYPGDRWRLLEPHDNSSAIARYDTDYERISQPDQLFNNPTVDIPTLQSRALAFTKKMKASNSATLLRTLRPASIFLDDHQRAVGLSLDNGLYEIQRSREDCDVALGSDSLSYAFRYLWGGDTLNINGRFEKPARGKFSRFRIYFAIASLNNSGIAFNVPYLLGNVRVIVAKFFEYRRGNDALEPTI